MIRTQIQLAKEQAEALKALAGREDRSMADVVRESVGEYLARRAGRNPEELRRRAMEVVGRFSSGTRDVAQEHDRYLDEIYGAES